MFQIHGAYTPLDVLIIARRSDPSAHFTPARDDYTPPQTEEDFLNSGRSTLITYQGQEVRVTGSWHTGTYLSVSGSTEFEKSLQSALGGVLYHEPDHCVPLTDYPASRERMAGLSALHDDPVSLAYGKSGHAPRYDALKRMTMQSSQEPRASAFSALCSDEVDLVDDVEKRLMIAGIDLLGVKSGDSALWRVSRGSSERFLYVSVNNPAQDYILSDAVRRRPELFDGLGSVSLFFDNPERPAPAPEASEETRSLPLLLAVIDALPEYRTLDALIPKLLSFDEGVSDKTPFCADYLLSRSASPMMASAAYALPKEPRGVLVAPRHALESVSLLHDRDKETGVTCKLHRDSVALAHALSSALETPVIVVPDLSGLSERNVVVVNPGQPDAAYLNLGGAFATKKESEAMKSIKRPSSVHEEYAPISLSGDKVVCEKARDALRETLLCVDLDAFRQKMEQAINRDKTPVPEP